MKLKKILIAVVFYCVMISVTFGYVQKNNGCYTPDPAFTTCSTDPFFSATFWPFYWIYRSGTLLFAPKEER